MKRWCAGDGGVGSRGGGTRGEGANFAFRGVLVRVGGGGVCTWIGTCGYRSTVFLERSGSGLTTWEQRPGALTWAGDLPFLSFMLTIVEEALRRCAEG